MYPDAPRFIDFLNIFAKHLFAPDRDLIITRAPGRLDVMGGIADYSGSLVLEFPIAEATFAAVQLQTEPHLNFITSLAEEPYQSSFSISLRELESAGDYEAARTLFQQDNAWAAYVAGVFLVLMRERGIRFASGANIVISSRVPPGKGVSSSAALEVAVMEAVSKAFNIDVEPRDIALLCQRVENMVVGAPCGVMDQMTAVFGERDRLLALLCQPAEIKNMIALPPQLKLWGIDSGIRHSVGGSDYGSVRAGAFMGLRIINEGTYLANISPAEFEEKYAAQLPERMSGEEFLARYQGTMDPVTSIDPQREYAVKLPTAHPIYENARVQRFVELLNTTTNFDELGELMYASHQSYTALGLNSEGTDLLVDLVRKESDLFGAKITGGGSGGTVAVLGNQNSQPAIDRIAKAYANETGHHPYIFNGSSSGSLAFGRRFTQINAD
jgi:galactokinase